VGVLLGLCAALAYGASDFAAGVGSRRLAAGPVTVLVQAFALAVGVVGVLFVGGGGPDPASLGWGALAGVGSGVGTLVLYRGMTLGAMSPVATSSAVLAAVVPAVVGVLTGDALSTAATAGIVLAVPAIGLVSWQAEEAPGTPQAAARSGLAHGVVAGMGFALLFVALDRAGSGAGAWPFLSSSVVALLVVLPFARGSGSPRTWRSVLVPAGLGGILGAAANLLFLGGVGVGQLAVVAVLTSLYPGVTVLLARVLLAERWTRMQAVGLLAAAGAVVLISAG
jgi:drug/metabolite transporter (DMT)-like permease